METSRAKSIRPALCSKRLMPLVLILLFLFASVAGVFGGTIPLTAKEIALMLRTGYSNEAVLRELSSRHYADTIDSAIEEQLTKAGANSALIEALRSGTYQSSPSEMAAVREKLAALQPKAPEDSNPSKQVEPEKQERNAPNRAKTPDTAPAANLVYRLLKGCLVSCQRGVIVSFDDAGIEHKKLYLFLFSSNGSKPGHKLTTQLVEYYNRVAPQHPEFEVVFFSADRSQFGMEACMTQSSMPWPAVAYEKLASQASLIQKDMVPEIPCLVLAEASGRVLSHSGPSGKGSTPEKVLSDLDRVLTSGSNALAQTP
jgi:Thioredoxin-like